MAGVRTTTKSPRTEAVQQTKQNGHPPVAKTPSPDLVLATAEIERVYGVAGRVREGIGFHDGYSNAYSDALEKFVADYGDSAFAALEESLPLRPSDIQALTLTYLACPIENDVARRNVKFFESYLLSDEWEVRDAAQNALECLRERSSLPALKDAIEREQSPMLKGFLQKTYDYINR